MQVRSRLLPDVVADHAGFFKVAGDMNAYLYTSSRAMHSDILNLLTGQVCGPCANVAWSQTRQPKLLTWLVETTANPDNPLVQVTFLSSVLYTSGGILRC